MYGILTTSQEGSSRDAIDHQVRLSSLAIDQIEKVFASFASSEKDGEHVMIAMDVERWLLTINLKLGRGSEFRSAVAAMKRSVQEPIDSIKGEKRADDLDNATLSDGEAEDGISKPLPTLPTDGYLTKQAFIDIYESEILQGKVWGVAHDLWKCGFPLPRSEGVFKATFDRIYTGGVLYPLAGESAAIARENVLLAVRDTGGRNMTAPCPNPQEPSDHLPVMAVVNWR